MLTTFQVFKVFDKQDDTMSMRETAKVHPNLIRISSTHLLPLPLFLGRCSTQRPKKKGEGEQVRRANFN